MVRGALPVAAFIATRSTDLADMSDWYKTDIRTPHKKNEVKKNRHFFMSGPYKVDLRRSLHSSSSRNTTGGSFRTFFVST
jgi:hypothetical protein